MLRVLRRAGAKRLLLGAFALLTFGLGVYLRVRYAISIHHPRHHVVSDAGDYVVMAERWLTDGHAQRIGDSIWPPGNPGVLALLIGLDPTLDLAANLHVFAGVATVVLIAGSAHVVFGWRAGCWASAFASLHPGFIHYTGYFLAEPWFQFLVAAAVFLSLLCLRQLEGEPDARLPRRAVLLAAAAGTTWVAASLFRANALPVVGVAMIWLVVRFARRGQRHKLWLIGAALLAGGLCLAPAADRCSRLRGDGVCLVANNGAMNMALGQAGEVYGLDFVEAGHPERSGPWVPPALLHHGYKGLKRIPVSFYDTRGILGWYFQELAADPGQFLVRAFGNGLDLLSMDYWPAEYGGLNSRLVLVYKQLFSICVLLPGLVGFWRCVRRGASPERARGGTVFMAGALLGVLLTGMLSMGEARYRIPFDAMLIALAGAVYAGGDHWSAEPDVQPGAVTRGGRRFFAALSVIVLGICLALTAIVLGVAHPKLALASKLTPRALPMLTPRRVVSKPASEFAIVRSTNTRWNAEGVFVFRCAPMCNQLMLEFPSARHESQLSVSFDANDRYRVFFYRDQELLGYVDAPARLRVRNLRALQLEVPEAARSGYDRVGVLPLYGDGSYSMGHLLPGEPPKPAKPRGTPAKTRPISPRVRQLGQGALPDAPHK